MASDAERIQDFINEFLVPMVTGQEVVIGLPIDRDVYEGLVAELETGGLSLGDVELELQRRVSLMLNDPVLVTFDRDALNIAVAIHQLLFSFHADAERGRVSDKRLAVLAQDTALLLSQIPAPKTLEKLLLYHVVTDPFFLLYRKDVQVLFRLGGKQFFGEEVEWLRLPFRWRVHHEEVLGKDVAANSFNRETGVAWGRLLQLSPLTRILRADRLFRHFSFDGTLAALKHPTLCREITHTIVDRGLPSFMPALAGAYTRLLEDPTSSREDRAYVARFLINLALTDQLWQGSGDARRLLDARYVPPSDALRFEAPDLEADPESGAPPPASSDSALREQLSRRGWVFIRELLERQDVLRMPDADRELEVTRQLQATLGRLEGELKDTEAHARGLLQKAFGGPRRAA